MYRKYGVDSKEFFEYSKPFFSYLIKLYNFGKFDDEIFAACFYRVIGAVKYGIHKQDGTFIPAYYDDTRVNIATFVHSVVRNHISSRRYRENKVVDCFDSIVPKLKTTHGVKFEEIELGEYEELKDRVYRSSGIEFDSLESITELLSCTENSTVKKVVLWQVSRLHFLSTETR